MPENGSNSNTESEKTGRDNLPPRVEDQPDDKAKNDSSKTKIISITKPDGTADKLTGKPSLQSYFFTDIDPPKLVSGEDRWITGDNKSKRGKWTYLSKNANVASIVQHNRDDPFSFVDFQQKMYGSTQVEYLMITRQKLKVKKIDETWHYLYLIKSRDNKNSQMLTTLMKSNTDEYRKLLLLHDDLNQVLYFQKESNTQKVALMLFLIEKLQYKKLLAFPHESSDSFMHSRLSPSKATFALVLKPDQVAVVMEASTHNWYENLGQNICKVSLPSDSKILDLALWDTEGCDIEGFNSESQKATLAVIDTKFRISLRVIEQHPATKKWIISESSQTLPPCNEDLGDIFEGKEIEDKRFVGLHVSLGVVMAVYIFEAHKKYLVVDQFTGWNSIQNREKIDDTKREEGYLEPSPGKSGNETASSEKLNSQGDTAGTSEARPPDINIPQEKQLRLRDVIQLDFEFDNIDSMDQTGVKCATYCSFQNLKDGKLKLFFTHCDLRFIADLDFKYDCSDRLFRRQSPLVYQEPNQDKIQQSGKMLLKEYASFWAGEEIHQFYLQKAQAPQEPPKIAILQRSCNSINSDGILVATSK